MRIEIRSGGIRLHRGQILKLVDAEGSTVCAVEGSVWITEENENDDVVLDPGDCYRVRHAGVTIIDALDSDASVTLR